MLNDNEHRGELFLLLLLFFLKRLDVFLRRNKQTKKIGLNVFIYNKISFGQFWTGRRHKHTVDNMNKWSIHGKKPMS